MSGANERATRNPSLDENAISKLMYSAAIDAHRTLGGPGLLEAVYEEALA